MAYDWLKGVADGYDVIVIGSGLGGSTTLFEQTSIFLNKGPDRVSPFFIPMVISGIVIAYVFSYLFSTSLPAPDSPVE